MSQTDGEGAEYGQDARAPFHGHFKENLQMAIKTNKRWPTSNTPDGDDAAIPTVRGSGGGIGSRLKPLIQRAKGAIAESIVDLDQLPSARKGGKTDS